MKHYVIPASQAKQRHLPFYLAMEEWVARRDDAEDGFFTWQVAPTVIFGRNQQIDVEVNLQYCRDNGIEYYRRKSGGGCVFADSSNIMLSYITKRHGDIASIFAYYLDTVCRALAQLGIEAEPSGRNDITIAGGKVSGNAFYRTPEGASIVHGTMLYDTDMAHMAQAITPSRSKLESKGVKSVESRITMLREHTSMSIDQFLSRFISTFATSTYTLTVANIAEVERIADPYYSEHWIMGRLSRTTHRHKRRIEGVGEIAASIGLAPDGTIADINLSGDFFPLADIDTMLIAPLKGVAHNRADVDSALSNIPVSQVIAGLDKEQLLNLIF